MKKMFAYIALIILIILAGVLFYQQVSCDECRRDGPEKNSDVIENVIVADSEEEKILGLSGKESLAQDSAMLFVYNELGKPGIWMKDMKFPIDIFWLDKNFKIVDFVASATPESYPFVFKPDEDSMYVLETNIGKAGWDGYEIGDSLLYIERLALQTE